MGEKAQRLILYEILKEEGRVDRRWGAAVFVLGKNNKVIKRDVCYRRHHIFLASLLYKQIC